MQPTMAVASTCRTQGKKTATGGLTNTLTSSLWVWRIGCARIPIPHQTLDAEMVQDPGRNERDDPVGQGL